jgi:hypothetical protein
MDDDVEAAAEVLSYFRSRDVEEPVTKDSLRAEMADLRAEIADLRAELTTLVHSQVQSSLRWMIATTVTMTSLVLGAIVLTA